MASNKLEREFHKAMIHIYERAKDETGYLATRFLQMVTESGGVETAKILIIAPATKHRNDELRCHTKRPVL